MRNNVLISVIVPVYNSEKTLEKCLNSIINQSLSQIEIIVINDGSTDNSLRLLQYFRSTDDRIMIINQENQGVSAARNNGIRIANGEYITFVDSDDWIEPNMLEKLYFVAREKNADICKCDCFIETVNGHKILENDSASKLRLSQIEALKMLFLVRGEKHFGFTWGKLYSRKILKKNNICFNEGISYSEDVLFVIKAILNSNNIYYIPHQMYHYNLLIDSSLTRGKIVDLNSKLDIIYREIENLLKKYNIFGLVSDDFYRYQYYGLDIILNNLFYDQSTIKTLLLNINNEICSFIKKYPNILNVELKDPHFKAKLKNFLLRKRKIKLLSYLLLFNYLCKK